MTRNRSTPASAAGWAFVFALSLALAACGGGGGGATGALTAPQAVAISVDWAELTVGWDAVPGATGYHVYIAADASLTHDNYRFLEGGQHAPSVRDTKIRFEGLVPGATYWAIVAAEKGSEEGPTSAPVSAILPVGPVISLLVTPGYGALSLGWVAPRGATGYQVFMAADDSVSAENFVQSWTTPIPSLTVDGLGNQKTWYFAVRALNVNGPGPTVVGHGTTKALLPVSDLRASSRDGGADLSWTAAAGAIGFDVFMGYDAGVSDTAYAQTWRASGTSISVGGLANGTTCWFVVRPEYATGYGLVAAAVSATPLPPITGLVAEGRVASVRLAWTGAPGATAYDVYMNDAPDVSDVVYAQTWRVTADSFTAPGLENGVTYWFAVRGVHPQGSGPLVGPVDATPSGRGTFAKLLELETGAGASGLIHEDLINSDGNDDLVVAARTNRTVSVWQGTGDAGSPYSLVQTLDMWGYDPARIAACDVDQDGLRDLLVLHPDQNVVYIHQNYGSGFSDPYWGQGIGSGAGDMVLFDVDGDGWEDLLVAEANNGAVTMYRGWNPWWYGSCFDWSAYYMYWGWSPACLAKGDFNGDGTPDLAVGDPGSYELVILTGGGWLYEWTRVSMDDPPIALSASDLDGDGTDEVVVTCGAPCVEIVGSLPGGGYGVRTEMDAPVSPASTAQGDFDGDGYEDLAVADASTGHVSVFLGLADGTFEYFWSLEDPDCNASSMILVGDFDGDGILDLMVTHPDTGKTTVYNGSAV